MIQLVLGDGKGREYRTPYYPDEDQHTLDAGTLTPNPGSAPFTGIKRGETCHLMVGHMEIADGRPVTFAIAWISSVNTTEPANKSE